MLVAFYYGYKSYEEIKYLFSEYKNIKSQTINIVGCNLILFGYGSEFDGDAKRKYSLYESNLNCRNLILKIEESKVVIESDWLASVPVFYSHHSGEASTHWSLLEEGNQQPDWIGRYVIKKYSYIPNERTILENVKRLLSNEKLVLERGKLGLIKPPTDAFTIVSTEPNEVLDLIKESINSDKQKKIMVPLSSGYDSRLLLLIAYENQGNKNLEATTYTLSESKADCFESTVARQVSQKLKIKWAKYYLTGYRKNESAIFNRVGGVTHINGDYYDYYAEQYMQSQKERDDLIVVSGIVGDAWAGKIATPIDRKKIAWNRVIYSHGIKIYKIFISKEEARKKNEAEIELDNFYKGRNLSPDNYLIELVRAKISVINFLCYSFESRGVQVKSPFLDINIVQKILGLSVSEKKQRSWQERYFSNFRVADKDLAIKKFKVNYLAIEEGRHKYLSKSGYDNFILEQNFIGKLIYKIIFNSYYRKIESRIQKNKIIEYIIRKLGYIRTDVIISILKVIYK